ncbi:O-antigen ligase domain-containing protein [bacterium]|nr:MAG: O-antigen ligase domain-containing protein [bacterium]
MLELYILITIFFTIFLFNNYIKGLSLYISLNLFFLSTMVILNIPGFPLFTLKRLLFIIVIIRYVIFLQKNRSFTQNKLRNFFLMREIKLIIVCMSLLMFITPMPIEEQIKGYFSSVLELFILIILIWHSFRTEEEIFSAFKLLFFSFFILCIYGIYNKLTGSNPYIEYFRSQAIEMEKTSIIALIYTERTSIFGRFQSFMYHPISYGGYLAMIFPYLLIFYLNTSNKFRRSFYSILLVILMVNVIFTNSRSAIIFLGISTFSIFAFISKNTRRIIISIFVIVIVMLIFSSMTPILKDYSSIIKHSFIFWEDVEQSIMRGSSLESRWEQIYNALLLFKEHPILGNGFGKTKQLIDHTAIHRSIGGAESYWITLMIDFGIIGVVLYILFFFKILKFTFYHKKNNIKNDIANGLMKATFFMTLGYLVFISATGELQTFSFFCILTALSTKYYFISNQKTKLDGEHEL